MITDWVFYAVAIPAVLLMGLGKGGFAGIGILSLPLLSLVVPPLQAIAIILPILMVQDIVSVTAFRKDFSARSLKILFPGSVIGVAGGYFTASYVSNAGVMILVGVISVIFVAYSTLGSAAAAKIPRRATWAWGSLWASIAGFASFIANAGGPPFQVFMAPQRLEPRIYAGTGALYFAALNYTKFLAFIHLGQVSATNLATSAALFPLAIVATMAGVWLVKRVPLDVFYRIIFTLTFFVGLKLIWDGAHMLRAGG